MSEIKIIVNKKHVKNFRMTLKDDKTVYVTVPFYASNIEISNFLKKNEEWISKAIAKYQAKRSSSMLYRNEDYFYIFGEKYNLVFKEGKSRVDIKEDTIYLYGNNINYLYSQLNKELDKIVQNYLNRYLNMLKDYKYYDVPVIKYRRMTSRWGVCYPKKNLITLNTYLVHYPLECIEYVVLHEMCHFIVPNHSKRFYSLIENKLHNYKDIKKKLV